MSQSARATTSPITAYLIILCFKTYPDIRKMHNLDVVGFRHFSILSFLSISVSANNHNSYGVPVFLAHQS